MNISSIQSNKSSWVKVKLQYNKNKKVEQQHLQQVRENQTLGDEHQPKQEEEGGGGGEG